MIASEDIHTIFFLGIGGIGMSGLARYFATVHGVRVCGYDRTPSPLTHELEAEGMTVGYEDRAEWVKGLGLHPDDTLVVRTPAVPADSAVYTYLREQGFDIRKRAEVLGLVTRHKRALCVAGTHGKTTTSTMIAHVMNGAGVNAFLGGISMNYNTNVLIAPESEYVVVEADEYDRSFHQLTPYMSVITAVDPDHLDIYGTPEAYREAFEHYTSLITGALVIKHGLPIQPRLQPGVKQYTYGMTPEADFHAANIRVADEQITFDLHTPDEVVADIRLGVPVWVNIENSVAAMAVAWLNGVKADVLRERMASFRGVQRRFNIHVSSPRVVYIDDYAHHPDEIATSIDSVRRLYPERRLTGVFQPHLFTRTRDFAEGFAQVLSTLDEVVLLPIYPARELPIAGVTSEMLAERIQAKGNKNVCVVEKKELVERLTKRVAESREPLVVMTIGAGDIDRFVLQLTEELGHR